MSLGEEGNLLQEEVDGDVEPRCAAWCRRALVSGSGEGVPTSRALIPVRVQGFSGRLGRASRVHSQSISVLVTSDTMFQRASSLDESQFTWQRPVSSATARDRGVALRDRQVPEAGLRSLPGGRGAV